ncbi:MAG: hypothetical protein H7Y28_16580 [Rhodoferax sp.]|nr:hypothetical protein [Rhodoferax sp.]
MQIKAWLGLFAWLWMHCAAAADIQELTLQAAEHRWTYYLHVPEQARGKPAPLVLVFHGAGGGGRAYLEKNGWLAESMRAGFVVAAPDGLPARPGLSANFLVNPRLWNSGQLQAGSPRSKVDDMAFVSALLDDIASRTAIDPQRVFATGHSNGAGMTFMVGARLSTRFAALATVMGLNSVVDAEPVRALPTLVLLGTDDPLNPLQGGTRKLPWGSSTVPPPAEGIKSWSHALGCAPTALVVRDDADLRAERFGNCRDGAQVLVWHLKGQGHAWPGGEDSGLPASVLGPNPTRINATREIWSFFASSAQSLRD